MKPPFLAGFRFPSDLGFSGAPPMSRNSSARTAGLASKNRGPNITEDIRCRYIYIYYICIYIYIIVNGLYTIYIYIDNYIYIYI